MFSTIIYILIALMLYNSAEVFDLSHVCGLREISLAFLGTGLFWMLCSICFSRLKPRKSSEPYFHSDYRNLDKKISRLTTWLSIGALTLFVLDIYVLRLPLLLASIAVCERIPTLGALMFMGLFLVYLSMIPAHAYSCQRHFFAENVTKKQFILSNLGFSLPALLPWVCISLVFDLIHTSPFPEVKAILESPGGYAAVLVLFLIAMALLTPFLIQWIWKCKPLDQGPERDHIEQICRRQGMEFRNILTWNIFGGSMITAGVMGVTKRFRYILVTRALLSHLTSHELEAVILHEIGHAKRHHPIYYILLFSGFMVSTYLLFQPVMLLLYLASPVYKVFSLVGLNKTNAHALMMLVLVTGSVALYIRFGFGFFMRQCERQADLYIFDAKWNPVHLISAFYKIVAASGQSAERPNWHHFSIGQRIRFIEKCLNQPEAVQAHHKKVCRILASFLTVFLLLSLVGYQAVYGSWKQPFSAFLAQNILMQQIEIYPDNANMYLLLADSYYAAKSFQKAAEAYEKVLAIDKDNTHALNNLAWLLLTCPDTAMRNSKRALALSARAVATNNDAHVWDTHARALSANGFHEQALTAACKALDIHLSTASQDETAYYEDQIKRIKKDLMQVKSE